MNAMRTLILLSIAATAAIATAPAQDINRAIRLRPDSGVITEGKVFTIYFANAIVAAPGV